jgi:branched-chain amino acid transport system permease protein
MRRRVALASTAVVVLALLPVALSETGTAQLATVGVYFVAILGLDVLLGHSGQISLGQGAFMAVGAYTTAILMADHGVRDLWTIPIAATVAGGAALLLGVPALRLSGRYLALATFAIAIALPTVLKKLDHLTGGQGGITLVGKPTQTGRGRGVWWLTNNQWHYALTWTVGVALFLLARSLLTSRFGRSLRALRDGELTSTASGVNRFAYKLTAFGISAAYAGVAGSLLAIDVAHVSPGTFPVQLSLFLLVGAVAGFFGSIWGAVFGGLLVEFLTHIVGLIPHVEPKQAGPTTFFFGVTLVMLMLLLPTVRKIASRLATRGHPRAS